MAVCYSNHRKLIHKDLASDRLGFDPGFTHECCNTGQVTEPHLVCGALLRRPLETNTKREIFPTISLGFSHPHFRSMGLKELIYFILPSSPRGNTSPSTQTLESALPAQESQFQKLHVVCFGACD